MAELRWRLILDPPRSGAENMARDHALARCVSPGEGVLRFYGWEVPTVSFGRNEPAGEYDRDEAARRGVAFVRRPTGGRAVLHHHEVTYAVVLPRRALGGPREAYRRIGQGLLQGLQALGVDAGVAEDGVVLGVDQGPCFRAPAPGEVMAAGRKLVGSAQVRLDDALLQHGSLILQGDQRLLATLAGREPQDGDDPATVASLAPGSTTEAGVRDALAQGCRLAWGGSWTEAGYRAQEEEMVRSLIRDRYGGDAWTWRR